MKRLKFLTIIFLLATFITVGQQKKYVSYTVKKGETIKSIAKDYNISTRELLNLNPDESRKPAPGTVIVVPNKNYGKAIIPSVENVVKNDLYIVKPKETEFGISKKFGITIDALKAANNGLVEGLKIGMKLIIPKPTITIKEDSTNYLLHTVIKDDTFFNLTRRYEVSESELKTLNPKLNEGLKLGMILKIKPINTEELEKVEEGIFEENIDTFKAINVVIMLPYQLNKYNDSTKVENFKRTNSLLNIVTEFHMGTQMAIDSLKQKGVKVNVAYFDTENSDYKLQYIVNKHNFNDTDVVIGPLFFEKAHWIAKHINAPVLAPVFSKKQTKMSASNLIKSAPDNELLEEKIVNYLEKNYKGENIIVLNDGLPETQSRLWQTVSKFKTFDSIQNITVIKPEKGYFDGEKVGVKLKEDAKNWVVLITDENVATSSAINSLKTFAETYNIQLIAFNKGDNFNTIDNNFLGKLNFLFPTADFLNMDSSLVKNFFKKYQAKNYSFPTKYAIRGFDVTYDALVRIATEGSLEDGLKAGKSSRISSNFNYNKKLFGSFENNGIYLVQYTKDLLPILLK